ADQWPLWLGALVALSLAPGASGRGEGEPRLWRNLILAWALLAGLAMASYPAINPFFQRRYLLDLAVPWSLVVVRAAGLGLALLRGPRRRLALGALAAAAAAQASFGASRELSFREAYAPVALIADRLNRAAAAFPRAPLRAYLAGYLHYEYWPALPGRPVDVAVEALPGLPPGSLVYGWGAAPPGLALVRLERGESDALVDRLRRSPLPAASLSQRP
ncbi:MAG: hypothetical protein ACYCWW_16285, partial [Deltaproteobacteria bacterium]